MPDIAYIKVSAIYKKLREAEKNNRVLYISGAVGFGKTTAVSYFFRKRAYYYTSGEVGYLRQKPDEGRIRQNIIVIDDISWIREQESREYIINLIAHSKKQIVLIGRSALSSWLRIISMEKQFLIADERDLILNPNEIRNFFKDKELEVSEKEFIEISEFSQGHPLTLLYIAYHMQGGIPYSKEIEEAARLDLHHYFDYAFYEKWNVEMREVLIALCQYKRFTVEMAEMITGNDHIPYLLDYAMSVGTFMIRHGDGSYDYRKALTTYFQWKQAIIYTKEQMQENYERAALYYEIHNQLEQALKYYEKAGNQAKVSRLLIKNAERHPGTAHFFETREYYFALPREMVKKYPILMSGMSMLHAIMFQPEQAEEWYQELKKYEDTAVPGSQEKKEAMVRRAYLDIALPNRGIHGVIDIMKYVAVLCTKKNIRLPEFSVTSNLPSIMNGGLDFSEWSRNDKELAVLMKKPIELVLGKYGVGLVNIALAESGFEKGTMDIYEVMTRLNSGYMMSDTKGQIEMCFAATGLLVKVHLSRGQKKVAENQVLSFRKKAVKEKAFRLLPNLDTMLMWIQLLEGNHMRAEEWLKNAPDENIAFCILDRYQYIHKVRCLIGMTKYTEAISLIERLHIYFTKYERNYLWIENQVLKAIVQYRLDNSEWEETLNGALNRCEYYHFTRIAGQEGIALKPLLDNIEEPSVSEKFLKEIRKENGRMARYYPNYLGSEACLKEPLTETENQILRLMYNNQTSEKICSLCGFTYNTLKFHNRNIYRKLGVTNRKGAEEVARRLGLYEK